MRQQNGHGNQRVSAEWSWFRWTGWHSVNHSSRSRFAARFNKILGWKRGFVATSKYGSAAIEAARMCQAGASPQDAWHAATSRAFGLGTASQVKSCPRGAFLGLASAGYISGVRPGAYTRSEKNVGYACEAVELLLQGKATAGSPAALWALVIGGASTVHNSQMDVVLALWCEKLVSWAFRNFPKTHSSDTNGAYIAPTR